MPPRPGDLDHVGDEPVQIDRRELGVDPLMGERLDSLHGRGPVERRFLDHVESPLHLFVAESPLQQLSAADDGSKHVVEVVGDA